MFIKSLILFSDLKTRQNSILQTQFTFICIMEKSFKIMKFFSLGSIAIFYKKLFKLQKTLQFSSFFLKMPIINKITLRCKANDSLATKTLIYSLQWDPFKFINYISKLVIFSNQHGVCQIGSNILIKTEKNQTFLQLQQENVIKSLINQYLIF